LCLVLAVFVVFVSSTGFSYASDIAPIFECYIGNEVQPIRGDAGSLGRWVDEEKLAKIDRFNFPASLLSFEKEGFILVLDSIRNRVCRFSRKGVFSGELKLPFKDLAIDFAYFPGSKRVFFVFQNSAAIGVVESDLFAADIRMKSSKIFDAGQLLSEKPQLCQKIWALDDGANSIRAADSGRVLVNFVMGGTANAIFEFNDGKFSLSRRLEYSKNAAGICGCPSFAFYGIEKGVPYVWIGDAESGKIKRFGLPAEFKRSSNGYCCRGYSVIGGTAAGDFFVLASFGNSDESQTAAYVYKFDKKGLFRGRTPVVEGPDMITNRHVAVDPSGAVIFMRKAAKERKIEFFRFEASEKN